MSQCTSCSARRIWRFRVARDGQGRIREYLDAARHCRLGPAKGPEKQGRHPSGGLCDSQSKDGWKRYRNGAFSHDVIATSSTHAKVKINDNGKLSRLFSDIPGMEVQYER